jgi:hypothetical protein
MSKHFPWSGPIHLYDRRLLFRHASRLSPCLPLSAAPCLLVCLTLACAFFVTAPRAYSEETAGQILAKLEKLTAEDRQRVLVERAKTEKEVTFYSSLQTSDPSRS